MRTRLVAATLVLILAAAGCSKSSSTPSVPAAVDSAPAAPLTVGGETANNHGTVDVTGKSSVDVQTGDYYFSPTVLHGTASQKLTLHITNNTQTLHNFSDDILKINQDIQPGQSINVKVQFGNVLDAISVFYCKYHQSSGMRGAIQVPR